MEGQVWHPDPREVTSSVLCGCMSWRAGAMSLAGQAMKVCGEDCPPEQRNAMYLSGKAFKARLGGALGNLV